MIAYFKPHLRVWLSVIRSYPFLNFREFSGSDIPNNVTAGYCCCLKPQQII